MIITGTSRGIGLELTKIALSKGHDVLAVARAPENSRELMSLKAEFPSLMLLAADLNSEYSELKIAEAAGRWPMVDVLINNAGIYEEDKTRSNFERSFLTNSIAPLFVTRSLLPLLKKSGRPLSLQITSQMGSIEDNKSGGSYAYRASKAALNMLYKSLSIDESWLISLLVHPGWVQTRMGGSGAPLTVDESAKGIWELVEKVRSEDSGRFLNYKGEDLPW